MALIGVGGLYSENDFNRALNSGFCEFIGCGKASMINKDLGVKLKNGKKQDLELDSNHPEKYSIPSNLWKMCITAPEWLPPVKGKNQK